MKTIACILLFLAFATGCSFKTGTPEPQDASGDLDRHLANLRRTIPFKPYEERYANAQIKERGRMRFLGFVCGQAWTEYDGMLDGWYESGVKECEMPYKNGELDGVALNWFPNGNRKYWVTWKSGKRDGEFTVFYDSEIVSSKGRFSSGDLVQAAFFDREGKSVTREQWLAIPLNRSFWD